MTSPGTPPFTSSARSQFLATVAANVPLCRDHYRLVLSLSRFPPTLPGQFIQVAGHDLQAQWAPPAEFDWSPGQRPELMDPELASPLAMLRRPFSLAGRHDLSGHVELDVIHRVVGVATHWLEKLSAGDRVSILGPLGNAFELPPDASTALLIGGGVGIPPMIYLAGRLGGRKAIAFAGALSRDLLPLDIIAPPLADVSAPQFCIGEFAEHGIPTLITTDDGSIGYCGYVTQALEDYLDFEASNAAKATMAAATPAFTLYTCGPEPMMKRVADIAIRRGLPCQVAVERAMACGMGTCQSCCIRVKKPDPALPPLPGRDWCYRLACTDGPIFLASQLLW